MITYITGWMNTWMDGRYISIYPFLSYQSILLSPSPYSWLLFLLFPKCIQLYFYAFKSTKFHFQLQRVAHIITRREPSRGGNLYKITRKHAFDQESDQKKRKKTRSRSRKRPRKKNKKENTLLMTKKATKENEKTFFSSWLFSWARACFLSFFLVFFYKFPPLFVGIHTVGCEANEIKLP